MSNYKACLGIMQFLLTSVRARQSVLVLQALMSTRILQTLQSRRSNLSHVHGAINQAIANWWYTLFAGPTGNHLFYTILPAKFGLSATETLPKYSQQCLKYFPEGGQKLLHSLLKRQSEQKRIRLPNPALAASSSWRVSSSSSVSSLPPLRLPALK